MEQPKLCDMTVSEILRCWPAALEVFIDLRMHCIGCPIGTFHTPADAAAEHDIPVEHLLRELRAAIEGNRLRRVRTGAPRRSGTAGAALGSGASGVRLARDPPVPRR